MPKHLRCRCMKEYCKKKTRCSHYKLHAITQDCQKYDCSCVIVGNDDVTCNKWWD